MVTQTQVIEPLGEYGAMLKNFHEQGEEIVCWIRFNKTMRTAG